MNKKFEHMLNNHINGNISDFKKELKGLSKIKLIDFLKYCDTLGVEEITIYSITRYLG